MNLSIDILVIGFPEHSSIKEPIQQLRNDMIKIHFKITLEQMENHNHVNNCKECYHNRTQQVQDNHSKRYPIVTQYSTLIVGHPKNQHNKRLQQECKQQ